MDAQAFLNQWDKTYRDRSEFVLAAWGNRRAYTREMINVVSDIALRNGLEMNTEYYSTDAILFRTEDAHQDSRARYIINPAVVFEHENDSDSITDEIAHHLLLDANLYVVVGYYHGQINDAYLEYLRTIIDKSRRADSLAERGNFLLILGYDNEWQPRDYWRGFLYRGDHWDALYPDADIKN